MISNHFFDKFLNSAPIFRSIAACRVGPALATIIVLGGIFSPALADTTPNNIIFSPKSGQQPNNEWFTAVWNFPKNINGSKITGAKHNSSTAISRSPADSPININTEGDTTKVSINSRGVIPASGKLLTVMHKKVFVPSLALWNNDNSGFSFTGNFSIPSYEEHGRSIGYVAAIFAFTDVKTKKSFWLVANLFDPRGNSGIRKSGHWGAPVRDSVSCAGSHSTPLPIAMTVLEPGVKFVHLSSGSGNTLSSPGNGNVRYDLSVRSQEMSVLLKSLSDNNGWCVSGDDYHGINAADVRLKQVSLEVEIYVGDMKHGTNLNEYTMMSVNFDQPKFMTLKK